MSGHMRWAGAASRHDADRAPTGPQMAAGLPPMPLGFDDTTNLHFRLTARPRGPKDIELAATQIREDLHWSKFNRNTLGSDFAIQVLCALGEHMDSLLFEMEERFGIEIGEREPFATKTRAVADALKAKLAARDETESDEACDRGDWRYHQRADQ